MKEAIIIFTRVPIKGHTKTRLETCLSKENCAGLHVSFIKDIYNTCKCTNLDIFVFYTPIGEKDILQNILGTNPKYYPQSGDNLGEKMLNAIETVLSSGYDSCILIGTDIPEIKGEYIMKGFLSLKTCDVVLGPTFDKGYCLIGMKKPYKKVFSNQTYGTGSVLSSTLEKIKNSGLTYSLLETVLDIDEESDLLMLEKRINLGLASNCENTAGFLKNIKGRWKNE